MIEGKINSGLMPFKLVFIQEQMKLFTGYHGEMSSREKLLSHSVNVRGSNADKSQCI